MGNPIFSFDQVVSPGGSNVLRVLKASPGNVQERLQAAALQEKNVNLQDAQVKPLDFSKDEDSKTPQYLVYISLNEPKSIRHMTVRKTIVSQSTYQQILMALHSANQDQAGNKWVMPCQISVNLYRDAATGLMSPTRKSVSRAFENTPAFIRQWLEIAATLNGSEDLISQILRCIPDDNIEYGYFPLGHTEKNACPRGKGIVPFYTSWQIEMSEIASKGIKRMQQQRLETIAELEKFVSAMDEYLKSDIGEICEQLKTPKIKTIADGMKEVEEVFAIARRLSLKGAKFNMHFATRLEHADKIQKIITENFTGKLYRELLAIPLLSGALISSTPLETCMTIPRLWLDALKK